MSRRRVLTIRLENHRGEHGELVVLGPRAQDAEPVGAEPRDRRDDWLTLSFGPYGFRLSYTEACALAAALKGATE